jgi:hypothetical protein
MKKAAIAAIAISALAVTGIGSYTAAKADSPAPVYVCQSFSPDCTDGNEIFAQDHNGLPIFAVGEAGGVKVFGDKLSVYSGVFTPSIVLSQAGDYPAGACSTLHELYVSTRGLFTCTSSGWHADLLFPQG